jgi:Mlc titration factor MtfA (ptsG expression regulator)
MVLRSIRDWFRRVFGPAPALDDGTWKKVLPRVRGARKLSVPERETLRQQVREFLHHKQFIAAKGFELQDEHRYAIAIQACIPILHIGVEAYRGFRSIYVFPDTLRERADEWRPGQYLGEIAGLAIQGGGVALAWTEARRGFADAGDGYNPVIHEFAHKLDMMDGAADGRPPLPDGITQREWFETFSRAFADFQARIDRGFATGLSDYAATNPAEFFAVLSEVYFEEPDVLEREYPGVMRLLRGFYTQRTVAGE